MKYQRSINLEHSVWEKLDSLKGDVPRSKFVEKIICKSIGYNLERT